jgi:hypothetical protein
MWQIVAVWQSGQIKPPRILTHKQPLMNHPAECQRKSRPEIVLLL